MKVSRFLIYPLVALLIYSLFLVLSAPLRQNISNRFLARGQTYLAQRQYQEAILEFNKSLKYNKNNDKTRTNLVLTQKIITDISHGLAFFKVHNKELAQKIIEAQKNYPHAKAALESGILNLESGDRQIALIAIKKATQMDPAYPEAWKILTDNYQESKKYCPPSIREECRSYFENKYQEARQKLRELDPTAQ